MTVIIEGEDKILLAQAVTRRWALHLEIQGLRRHGRSAYVICKEAYGLRGNRASVLKQMDELIEWRRTRLMNS